MLSSYTHERSNSTSITKQSKPQSFFSPATIQPKLTINPPNDIYEQQADAMAEKVMRMPAGGNAFFKSSSNSIQRKCAHCEEEEKKVQMKSANGSVGSSAFTNVVQSAGQPLDANTRSFMEPRFGRDFSNVRIHNDAEAATSARSINAMAYTSGNDIVFGQNQFSPTTNSGKQLLAHELTHVIQQGDGRTQSNALQLARLPCRSQTSIDMFFVSLPGSTRSVETDVANANNILCQCGIQVNIAGGESWNTDVLDKMAPSGVLNDVFGIDTDEVVAMTSHRPGGDKIHAYYVPAITTGFRGQSFGYSGVHENVPPSVAVANIAAVDTFAHELVHVLLSDGGHHSNPDNLMGDGSTRHVGVDELEQSQCDDM